jgi:NAD(P)-dependent dehydrogenase (short-subunit alcohol dehydrogenase family)
MGLGAAKAIGSELDMTIVVADVSQAALDKAVAELRAAGIPAEGFKADVTDRDQVAELVAFAAAAGSVKGLLNLAGISPKGGPDYRVSCDTVFDIAVKGTVYFCQAASKAMADGGCIINISSTSPFLVPPGSMQEALYPLATEDFERFLAEMHAALEASGDEQMARNNAYVWGRRFIIWYTEWLACQVGRQGIRVVSVGPGVVDGPMVEESGLGLAKMSAVGRTGRPEELAAVYAFLMSDKASYVTGTNLMVDGGIVAALHNMKR